MFYTRLGYHAFLLFPSLETGKMTSDIIFGRHVQKIELKQSRKPQSFARIETKSDQPVLSVHVDLPTQLESKQKCIFSNWLVFFLWFRF